MNVPQLSVIVSQAQLKACLPWPEQLLENWIKYS